jgi:hypothetical protein
MVDVLRRSTFNVIDRRHQTPSFAFRRDKGWVAYYAGRSGPPVLGQPDPGYALSGAGFATAFSWSSPAGDMRSSSNQVDLKAGAQPARWHSSL